MTRRGLPQLTGSRFFAAFAVVVFHYGRDAVHGLGPLARAWAGAGPQAVSYFYVLSGAVLTWGCTGPDGLPDRPRGPFWWQRAARILPAYWLALALALLPFAAQVAKAAPGADWTVRTGVALLSALLLLQAFAPPLVGLNTPGWSISCEAFFYALWPGLVGRLRSGRASFPWAWALALWLPSLLATALTAALLWGSPGWPPWWSVQGAIAPEEFLLRLNAYFPPLRLPEFLLGIAVGHALRRAEPAAGTEPAPGRGAALFELLALIALGAATAALGAGVLGERADKRWLDRLLIESGLLSPVFAVVVWRLARGGGPLAALLSAPPLVALGEASFALYILQEPVLSWTTAGLKRAWPAAMAHWSVAFWAYALLLVLLSLAAHRFVEVPLRGLFLRRLAKGRATI